MTELEKFISEEQALIRSLKIYTDDGALSDWGLGYNEGVEHAADLAETILKTAMLKAKDWAVR